MKPLVVLHQDVATQYELENLYEVFVPKSKFTITSDGNDFASKFNTVDFGLKVIFNSAQFEIELLNDQVLEKRTLFALNLTHKEIKTQLKRTVYDILARHMTPLSKWGILVGIRPVKIVHELLDAGQDEKTIRATLRDDYRVSEEKINLMVEVANKERPYLVPNQPDAISLYLCIPFCPTRCLYCSFPSNDLARKGKLLQPYLDKLEREVIEAINHIHQLGKYVDCIYVGGGTPTSITEAQLASLLRTIAAHLPLDRIKEYTVEAGRPDTITKEKLEIMKTYGVDRICVNPQTMNPGTLVEIGRSHDAESIVSVMQMAKTVGFKTINMDLIMGLPGETVVESAETLSQIIALEPENITIHTLAVKRASRLNEDLDHYELTHDQVVEAMLEDAEGKLRGAGFTPYYMYRQKKMIGHLENVGYAKQGHESLYNMRIMEEKHSIVACGAGAVSKICEPEINRFDRVANFKGLEDYLDRFEEILEKKRLLK